MRFLWRIAIPLARPVIAALAVFSFLGAWNQYLWPALLTNNNQSHPHRADRARGDLAASTATAGIVARRGRSSRSCPAR